MSLLVLSSADVDAVVPHISLQNLLMSTAQLFTRISSSASPSDPTSASIDSPHRISTETSRYTTLYMPSRVDQVSAVKIVSVPSKSTDAHGLPATTCVLDVQTGAVRAVVNARSLTGLRTAAGSALATTVLQPDTPRTLLAFGAGRQIQDHIELLVRTHTSLEKCTIVNREINDRAIRLSAYLREKFPSIEVHVRCALDGVGNDFDLGAVVSEADIICTATPSTRPLFDSTWVRPGTHLNLVGSYKPDMREVDMALIRRAGKVVVDSRKACLVEAGEVITAGLRAEDLVELGELVHPDGTPVQEKLQVVKNSGDVTIFKSVGLGAQDVVIADLVVSQAEKSSIGTLIPSYD